jgi:hypothetical protein
MTLHLLRDVGTSDIYAFALEQKYFFWQFLTDGAIRRYCGEIVVKEIIG